MLAATSWVPRSVSPKDRGRGRRIPAAFSRAGTQTASLAFGPVGSAVLLTWLGWDTDDVNVAAFQRLYSVLNLMSLDDLTFGLTASVLGYCLLPMVALSAIGIVLSLKGIAGAALSLMAVMWCAHSASKMFAAAVNMHDQRALIAYPCFLLYGVFAIITVF